MLKIYVVMMGQIVIKEKKNYKTFIIITSKIENKKNYNRK